MADNIRITLDTSQYLPPTDEDVDEAKAFIVEREETARKLRERIEELLALAAVRVMEICYKYMTDPRQFIISSDYNQDMMNEITEVMDELEDDILSLIYEYSTRATNDRERMMLLAAWMASLGRGNNNLKDTLHGYLLKTLKDWEAVAVATKFMGRSLTEARAIIKNNIGGVYTIPDVLATFRRSGNFIAPMIRFHGVTSGAVGLSNNGSVNVMNMAVTTLQMAWMKELQDEYKEDNNIVGYYVLRGSGYDCPRFCQPQVGFHRITDTEGFPPQHPHCCCYTIPIRSKADLDSITTKENKS